MSKRFHYELSDGAGTTIEGYVRASSASEARSRAIDVNGWSGGEGVSVTVAEE